MKIMALSLSPDIIFHLYFHRCDDCIYTNLLKKMNKKSTNKYSTPFSIWGWRWLGSCSNTSTKSLRKFIEEATSFKCSIYCGYWNYFDREHIRIGFRWWLLLQVIRGNPNNRKGHTTIRRKWRLSVRKRRRTDSRAVSGVTAIFLSNDIHDDNLP